MDYGNFRMNFCAMMAMQNNSVFNLTMTRHHWQPPNWNFYFNRPAPVPLYEEDWPTGTYRYHNINSQAQASSNRRRVVASKVSFVSKSINAKKPSYYAVAKGWRTGIYQTPSEATTQLRSFKYGLMKKFKTRLDALAFIDRAKAPQNKPKTAQELAKGLSDYYAVAVGKNPGIYDNLIDAQAQIISFRGHRLKKFKQLKDANDFIAAFKPVTVLQKKNVASFKRKRVSPIKVTNQKTVAALEQEHVTVVNQKNAVLPPETAQAANHSHVADEIEIIQLDDQEDLCSLNDVQVKDVEVVTLENVAGEQVNPSSSEPRNVGLDNQENIVSLHEDQVESVVVSNKDNGPEKVQGATQVLGDQENDDEIEIIEVIENVAQVKENQGNVDARSSTKGKRKVVGDTYQTMVTSAKKKCIEDLQSSMKLLETFTSPIEVAEVLFENFKGTLKPLVNGVKGHDGKIRKVLDSFEHHFGLFRSGQKRKRNDEDKRDEPPSKKARGAASGAETNQDGLQMDKSGFVHVYTDGSCCKKAGAGLGVWWNDDHPFNKSGRVSEPDSSIAEIEAVIEALKTARQNGIDKVKVFTDHMTIVKWGKSNMEASPKLHSRYGKWFEKLKNVMKKPCPLTVQFEFVKAHSGVYGNEKADKLAKQGKLHYKKWI